MPIINVFRNTYIAPENRLTYNFLCMIDLIHSAQAPFIEFLLQEKVKLSTNPIIETKPVYAFKEGYNPDGCIRLRCMDNSVLSVYLEVKTNRRELDTSQLMAHLKYHVNRDDNALLLVITPRHSDIKIVRKLNEDRILFISWQNIEEYLKTLVTENPESKIIVQFLEYAHLEGEFMPSELTEKDISIFIDYYTNRPDCHR